MRIYNKKHVIKVKVKLGKYETTILNLINQKYSPY